MEGYKNDRRNSSRGMNGDQTPPDIQISEAYTDEGLTGGRDTSSLPRRRSNIQSFDAGIPSIQIYDASDDDDRRSRPESITRRKSSTGSVARNDNGENVERPKRRRPPKPDASYQRQDQEVPEEDDASPIGYSLPDFQDFMKSPRRRSRAEEKLDSPTEATRTSVSPPTSRTPRGSISASSPGQERRRSVNDISFNIQSRKSITEMTPKMQAQIAKFETPVYELESEGADQTGTITFRRNSKDINDDYGRRRSSSKEESPYLTRRRSSTRDEVLDLNRRGSSKKDESPDLIRRRSSTRDEAVDLNRRRSSTRDEVLDLNRRRSSTRDEVLDLNRRRSSTRDEVLDLNRRRSSTRDEVLDLNRRRSSTRGEVLDLNRRRSSTRDEAPDLIQRRSSTRDEAPDLTGRRSSSKGTILDSSSKSSATDEITNFDQRKSSIRGDSLGNDAMMKLTERRKSSTRDDALAHAQRKSLAGDDIFYADQRRPSLKEPLPNMERRPSLKDKVNNIEKSWLVSKDIDALERRLSIQEPEAEPESESEVPEGRELPLIQVRRFSDLLDEDDDNMDDEELEEQFRKSMTPYLKYRKSVSDLEPYLQHQEEISHMTPEIKSQLQVNEMGAGKEIIEPLNITGDVLLSDNPSENEESNETLNAEALNYLVRRFSSEPIPYHKSTQPESSPQESDRANEGSPGTDENDDQMLVPQMTPRRRSSIVLEERWSKRSSQAGQESSSFTEQMEKLGDSLSIDASTNLGNNWSSTGSPDLETRSPGAYAEDEAHSPRSSTKEYLPSDELELPIREDQRRKSLSTTFFDFVVRRLSAQVEGGIDITSQEDGHKKNSGDSEEQNQDDIDSDNIDQKDEYDDNAFIMKEDEENEETNDEAKEEREVTKTQGDMYEEKEARSPRGSSAGLEARSPRVSSAGLEARSPRGSSAGLEARSPRGSSAGLDNRSLRGSSARLEGHSPRGSSAGLENRSPRGSTAGLETRSPRASSAGLETRSPRGSSAGLETRSPRGSSAGLDNHSPRGSSAGLETRSPRGSSEGLETRSPRGSSAGLDNHSPRGSTVGLETHSPKASSAGLEAHSPRGLTAGLAARSPRSSSAGLETRSPRGSSEGLETRSPRGSSAGLDNHSPRGSTAGLETRSPRASSAGLETSSPRGSSAGLETRSPRGSSAGLETRSPRGSSAGLDNHSPRGSTAGLETRSPRGSTAGLETRSPRGSSAGLETRSPRGSSAGLDNHSPRGSTAGLETRSPRGSTAGLETRSPRGSTAGLETRSPRGSSAGLENHSPRGSTAGLETRSPRASSAGLETRSPRGSSAGPETSSPRGSSAGLEARSPRGSSAGLETRSPRGSTAGLEARSPRGSSAGLETRSPRGSSAGLETHSPRGSLAGLENRSPRGSSAGLENRSLRGSSAGLEDRFTTNSPGFTEINSSSRRVSSGSGSSASVKLTMEDQLLPVPLQIPVSKEPRKSIGMEMFNFLVRRFSGVELPTTVPSEEGSENDNKPSAALTKYSETPSTENIEAMQDSVLSHGALQSSDEDLQVSNESDSDLEMTWTVNDPKHEKEDQGFSGEHEDKEEEEEEYYSDMGDKEETLEARSPRSSSAGEETRLPRGSSAGLENHSPRASSAELENRSPRGSSAGLEACSPRGSSAGLEARSPRGSSAGLEARSPRVSSAGLEARSPRGSSAGLEACSPRGSSAGLEARSPRGSSAGLEARSPRVSSAGLEARSPRGSSAGLESRSPRGSPAGLEARSPRGSSAGLEARSPRGSSAGLEACSPRGSSAGLEACSPRGSSAGLEARSPRGSSAGLENRSPRGSSAGLEAHLPRGLSAGLEARSPRGSSAGLEARSPRGSSAGLKNHSPRGSSAGLENRVSLTKYSETPSTENIEAMHDSVLSHGALQSSDEELLSSNESDSDLEMTWTVNDPELEESTSKSPSSTNKLQQSSTTEYSVSEGGSPSDQAGSFILETLEQKNNTPLMSIGSRVLNTLRRLSGVGEESGIEEAESLIEDTTRGSANSSIQRNRLSSHVTVHRSSIGSDGTKTESEEESESDNDELDDIWDIKKVNGVAPPGVTTALSNKDQEQEVTTEYYLLDLKTGDLYGYEIPDVYSVLYHQFFGILGGEDFDVIDLELNPASQDSVKPLNKEDSSQLKSLGKQLMDSVSRLDGSRGWTTMENFSKGKKKSIDDITAVTFCGCGFLGVYLVGVATYMQQHTPKILKGRLGGSSVGSLIATCLACDLPLELVRKSIIQTAEASREYMLGVFNPFFPLEEPLLKNLLEMLPEDAHIRASGRLHLSLTRASTLTNEVVSHYETRDELLRAVLCCCFLPGVSGFSVPTFQGRKYIDGGISNNIPLKGPTNLSVNVFAGEFDISPEEQNSYGPTTAFNQTIEMSAENVRKFFEALLPPKDLDAYFDQGYNDAKKYFST